MNDLAALEHAVEPHRLAVFGAFHTVPSDALPGQVGTVILLGPAEPGFWPHVTAEPEWRDGQPDPLDRWSARIIGAIAKDFGGYAVFPSDGPPYRPFYQWAIRSGRAFVSPVSLLVHDVAGLFASYRGAIALPQRLSLPPVAASSPCENCAGKPCLTACPAKALTGSGYDVPGCHRFLDTSDGEKCLSFGCGVRRTCPLSHAYGRLPEQSAYHMGQFHK